MGRLFLDIASFLKKQNLKITVNFYLKGVFAKNERGYMLPAKNDRFYSLLIILPFLVSIIRKLLTKTHTKERSVHTN